VPRGAFEDGTALALRYYAFRSGAWLAERLPLRLTDAVANLGGRIAFRLAKPPRREVVARNMARVAGGPGTDGESLVKGAYLSYARYWLETFRLGRYSRQDLLDMVDGVNVEIVDRAVGERSGLLAVLPHFGFYDLVGAWAGAKDYPLTTVAEVLKPRVLYEWFAAIRERRGIRILPARPGAQTLRGLLKVLADGEIVALVADRDLSRRGIWVDYFGERTTAPVGPALLAARTGVPLAAVAFYQTGPERFRCEVTTIPYERTGDESADLPVIAQAIASALEEVIRKAPEQYHLFSTNWPSDEPGLPPRGRARPAPQEGP
jgi:lauroyl/myristoyl acyltransferase